MNRIVIVTLSLVLFLGLSSAVQGQHFEFTRTDGNASILVSEALFNGEDLVADDEVGVFTEAGLCAGATIVNEPGAQLGISAFGDEAGGEVDGFGNNEPFAFRFWDHEAEAEIGNVEAEYAAGNGRYAVNGFHVVSLSAAADAPPILVEPEEVDFGNVGVGEQADDVVVVTNVGDEPFMITNVGVDGDGFSAEFEGGGGGGEEFPWEFTRTDANMSVLVQSAQIDGEDIVAGDYVGVYTGDGLCAGFSEVQEAGAQLGVAAFGDEAGGEVDGFAARELIRFRMWDSEGGFEVAVDGDDVEIGGGENAWVANGFLVVSLSGDAPAQGVTLDPEDTLEIPVHFNPENAGDHNGTLTINTNIEGFGEVDVPLSGNGEEERFPAINVSTDAINFEDLEVGDSADQTFTISNEGDADLNVDGVTVESDHFSVDVDGGFTLEPGQDRVVTATFGPQDAGDHAAEVMITSDDPSNGDITVALSGSAFFVPMILVEPADGIDFGDVPVGEAGHAVAEISNIGRVPFIVSDVFVNGDGFSVDFEGGGGGGGDEIDWEFTRTDANMSVLVQSAQIDGEDISAGDFVGVFTGDGLCAGFSEVQEAGAQLGVAAFGDEAGGEVDGFAARELIRFRMWDTEAGFEVMVDEDDVEIGGGENAWVANGFVVVSLSAATPQQGVVLQPDEMIEVDVHFNPGEAGDFDGSLVVASNVPDNEEVAIDLSGTGIAARDIDVTPGELGFGDLYVGEERSAAFTISNTGEVDLQVESVSVESDHFSVNVDGGFTLGGGEERDVTVTFAPQDEGDHEADVMIVSDDPDEGEVSVHVMGTGMWFAMIRLDPDDVVDFGEVGVDDEAEGTLTIHNDGRAPLVLGDINIEGDGFSININAEPADFDWEFERTDGNMSIIVGSALIGEDDAAEGDAVGVFTENGLCAGYSIVREPGEQMGVSAFAAEPQDDNGFQNGEEINYRIFDEDAGVEYSANAEYNAGNGEFQVNGFAAVSLVADEMLRGGALVLDDVEPGGHFLQSIFFSPDAEGDYNGSITIASNDPFNGEVSVDLTGSAFFVPMILVEPADGIDFGDVPVGEAGHAVAEISNIGRVPFIVSDVFVNGDGFSVDFEGGGGGGGDEIDWEFTRTDANMSVLVQSAQIDGEDISAGDFVGVFTGDGLCAGFSEVQEAGAQLGVAAFGDEAGGEVDGFAARELIRFRMWDTEAGFEVMVDEDDVEIGGGENAWVANGFVVVSLSAATPQQGVVLQPDEMIEVDVHFNPGEAGDFDGSLVVASNVPDNEEVAIDLSGTGIAARDIDVTPGELGFGDLYVGEERSAAFTISNTGEVDLQVESVSVESDHFSVNVDGGFTLGGGEERDVTVTFAPQDEGDHEADVMIVSDDPDEGEVSVHVMGTGMWFAMIRLDPDDVVDFGEVGVDDEAEGTLTIHNDGRAPLVLGDINIEGDGFSININAEPADFDWEFERTDGNMSIIVGSALIGEDDAAEGDAVGVFTENGLCAGYSIVREPGEQMGVSAFAAEPQDDNGFQNGEEINYRIFDEDAGVEYSANAEYNAGNGEFQVNGFAAVSLVADEMLRGGALVLDDVEPGGHFLQSIFFSPDAEGDYNGSITIASNDPFNGEVSVDLTGSARNRNTPPELDEVGDQEVDEGQELVIDLSAFDAEDDDLEFGHNGLPEGAEFDGNTFMWTPSFDQAGDYEVTFTVSDGEFDDDETITIMVNNVNRRPVVDSPIRDVEVNEDDRRLVVIDNLNNVFSDPDGDELSFEVFGSDDLNLEITNGSRLSLRPEANYFGESDVTVTASDGGDGQAAIVVNMNLGNDRRANARRNVRSISADAPDRDESVDDEFHVTVNPINDAPVLSEIGGQEVDEGQELSFELDANDVDNEDLEFNANDLPEGAELNGNTFTWTPGFDQAGDYTITFTVTDHEDEDSEEVSITVNNVNRPPVLSEIGAQEVNENQELTISLEASDADDDDLEFGHEGLPEGAEFDGNTFTWTPGFNQAGDYEVTFTVTDGEAGDSETVSISVNNVNRAPVLADIGDQEVDEGQELAGTLEADDADNDDLQFGHRGLPEGAELNGADFTWTPGFDQAGDYTITFTVTDHEDEDSEEVSITVNNVNRPPTLGDFNDGNHLEGEEGETFEFTVEGSDPDGGDLSFEMTSNNLPDGLFADNGNNTASFSWETTSDDGSNEDYSGTVTVSDGEASASIDFTITVINVMSLQYFTDFTITDVSHSIIIQDITDEDETVPTEWEVGIFTPDGLLAGAEVWDAEANGGIGVAAWGDDANTEEIDGFNAGEQLNFRLWDFEADEEMGARAELLNGTRTWESNGFSIFTLSTATTVEITIEFVNGWNMISINVSPGEEYYNPDREDPGPDTILMLEQLSDGDDHAIVIFKNDRGAFYSPPNNFRNLYFWDLEEGYSCRTNTAINGTWLGEPIPANTEFPIFRNWNFIPYYPDYELPAGSREDFYVLQSIIDHVIIAKNGQGRFMAPRVPFSNMPPWRTTQGYQVKVDEDLEFSYPGPFGGGDVFLGGDNLKANQHYTEPTITGDNMSVLIKAVNGYRIGYYDQIAAYTTDGRLVGSGNFEENGAAGIAVWGDDPTTDAIDGLLKDEAFELRIWNSDEKIESRLDAVKLYEGELKYSTDGFLMLNVAIEAEIPQDYYLSKAYPNPFNATTHLTYGMPEEGYVSIKVYDLRGGLVETIVEGVASAGKHAITWGGNDIASGVYIVRLAVGSTQLSRKVVLMR